MKNKLKVKILGYSMDWVPNFKEDLSYDEKTNKIIQKSRDKLLKNK